MGTGDRGARGPSRGRRRSEEHTSELQSRLHLVCRLLLEKKKNTTITKSTSQDPARQLEPTYSLASQPNAPPVVAGSAYTVAYTLTGLLQVPTSPATGLQE